MLMKRASRMLAPRHLCFLALGSLFLANCGTRETQETQLALDQNGNGLCDFSESPSDPPPMPEPVRIAYEAPASLKLKVALAPGVAVPSNGRVALLVDMPTINSLKGIDSSNHQFELFTASLPATLPAEVELKLEKMPQHVVDEIQKTHAFIAGEEITDLSITAQVVIYDDLDGDGAVGLGDVYAQAPGDMSELDSLYAKYGDLDFIHISSPIDARNEVLSATKLSVAFHVNSASYLTFLEEKSCQEYSEGDSSCTVCVATATHFDLNQEQAVTVAWSIPR